ncbi:MAG: DUF3027 domain-containing protein [Leucobacter sp.]
MSESQPAPEEFAVETAEIDATGESAVEAASSAPAAADSAAVDPAPADSAAADSAAVADPVLLAARDQARDALAEIADAQTIGAEAGHEAHEEHVLTLFFECRLPGYPGWRWAATLARVDEESPVTVLEVELLPGEGAVVAPEWVPWSVRLAQYREAQARQAAEEAAAAEAAAEELSEEDDVEPEDDLLENDFSDFDDEIDGVEIDEEDEEDDDDLDEESEEDEPDEDEADEDD